MTRKHTPDIVACSSSLFISRKKNEGKWMSFFWCFSSRIKDKQNKNIYQLVWHAVVVVLVIIIMFLFSSQDKGDDNTGMISRPVRAWSASISLSFNTLIRPCSFVCLTIQLNIHTHIYIDMFKLKNESTHCRGHLYVCALKSKSTLYLYMIEIRFRLIRRRRRRHVYVWDQGCVFFFVTRS